MIISRHNIISLDAIALAGTNKLTSSSLSVSFSLSLPTILSCTGRFQAFEWQTTTGGAHFR